MTAVPPQPAPRVAFLRSLFDPKGHGLEIGPLHNPVAPKREGFNVEIVDHAVSDDLRAKYRGDARVDTATIEEVDFVWSRGALRDAVQTRSYDWIVASHVIEHIPDPVTFLADCENLLRPGGRLILAVPDRRKCFDAFRPGSTLGQLVEAQMERRVRHRPAALFDSAAYTATLSGRYDWADHDVGAPDLLGTPKRGQSFLEAALRSQDYTDAHGWVFTPSSFRLAMVGLLALGLINLKEVFFAGSPGCEFFLSLGTDGLGCPLSLQDLARAAVTESAGYGASDAFTQLIADLEAARREAARLAEEVRALKQPASSSVRARLRSLKAALWDRRADLR